MKGTALTSAVLLLLCAVAAAHRPINNVDAAEELEHFEDAGDLLRAHGMSTMAVRRRLFSIAKTVNEPAGFPMGTDEVINPDHYRQLQQGVIQGLIDKRRAKEAELYPNETKLERFGRKAKKTLNFAMGTFSVVSTIGCFIPGLQVLCAGALLG